MKLLNVISDQKWGVGQIALCNDERLIAVAVWDGSVRLYDYMSGTCLAILTDKLGESYTVAASANSSLVAAGGALGWLLWDIDTKETLFSGLEDTADGCVDDICISNNNRYVVLAKGSCDMIIYDLIKSAYNEIKVTDNKPFKLSFLSDSLVVTNDYNRLVTWDIASGCVKTVLCEDVKGGKFVLTARNNNLPD